MAKSKFQDEIDVLGYQRNKVKNIVEKHSQINDELDSLEREVKFYIENQGIKQSSVDEYISKKISPRKDVCNKEICNKEINDSQSFDELLNYTHNKGYSSIELREIATIEEINTANSLLNKYYHDFTEQYKLDKYDYAISGIVGTIAALTDYFFVTKVDGNKVNSGVMKSGVEKLWEKLLSYERIEFLEKKFKVSYDISSNTSKISQEVLGLCPSYHRFQSLGHDPILCFIFGVKDLMKGQLTAIDGNGRWIVQSVQGIENKSFIESLITVFGHFLSDVATRSNGGKVLSVPAPLTPLLQLLQFGSIEYNDQKFTIADLSKRMYGDGYNFNHFIGMSIPVLLNEILIKLYFVIKSLFHSNSDVNIRTNPRLNIMMCISNGILFAENTGKVAITKNPFAINYISWITTAKYGFKTLKWISYDREIGKINHAQQQINKSWQNLEQSSGSQDKFDSIHYIE